MSINNRRIRVVVIYIINKTEREGEKRLREKETGSKNWRQSRMMMRRRRLRFENETTPCLRLQI